MLINIFWFYFGWWGIALTAAKNHSLLIPFVLLLLLLFHLVIHRQNLKKELSTMVLISSIGIAMDALLHFLDIFTLQKNYLIWLPAIWVIFSGTVKHSLKKFLALNNIWVFIIGSIGGPLSYYLASNLALIHYPISIVQLFIHAMIWGLFCLIMKLSVRIINETN